MMNKTIPTLLALIMFAFAQVSQGEDAPKAGTNEKQLPAKPAPNGGTAAPQVKTKKATVPETAKDKENKKKCRDMGGTYQLGHCNIG